MHPNEQSAILDRILNIASRASADMQHTEPGARQWETPGGAMTSLGARDMAEFRKLIRRTASKSSRSDRFSEEYLDDRLSKVLVAAHRRGREDAAALLADVAHDLSSFSTEQRVFLPIRGLDLLVSELSVGQVTIRRGVPPGVDPESEVGRYLVERVYAEYQTVAEPIKAGEKATEQARRAIDAITFAHVARAPYGGTSDAVVSLASEGIAQVAWLGLVSDGASATSLSRPQRAFGVMISSGTLVSMEASGLGVLSQMLRVPASDLSEFEDSVLRAVHWFAAAQGQLEVENRLLNLTTALETLVSPSDRSTTISGEIGDAVALILASGYEHRKSLKQFVVDQYNARSRVSHGGRRGVTETDAGQVRQIVAALIEKMLPLREVIKDRKDLFEWLERTRLGGALATPGTSRTIREIREERGITFMELVHRLRCMPEQLDHWEKAGGDLGVLRKVADELGFPIDRIALPANTVLINHNGHRFMLTARQVTNQSWQAKVVGWDPTDAEEWPCREVDPEHPGRDSPSIIVGYWTSSGNTAREALESLATRVNDAMARALSRTRLPEEPEDWECPDIPQHWRDHLEATARKNQQHVIP
jgi:transcriptional regulator with XRE-family HTH domain